MTTTSITSSPKFDRVSSGQYQITLDGKFVGTVSKSTDAFGKTQWKASGRAVDDSIVRRWFFPTRAAATADLLRVQARIAAAAV